MKQLKPPQNIIRYQNDFCDVPLMDMKPTDINIFLTICYIYQQELWEYFHKDIMLKAEKRHRERNGDKVFDKEELYPYIQQEDIPLIELSFREIKKISEYKTGSYRRMAEDIRRTNKKLLHLNTEFVEQRGRYTNTEQFSLFDTFLTYEDEKVLRVAIDRRFARILFDVEKAYTDNEIREIVQLHTAYSKNLYRQLKRWNTGKWIVSIEDFRRLCCVSDNYSYNNMKFKIIEPSVQELRKCFPHLEWKEKTLKKRGSPVDGFLFTFEPKTSSGIYKETGFICRECGKPLYEKEINGKICWCHIDGAAEDAECSKIYNSVAEVKGYSETPQRASEKKVQTVIANRLSEVFDWEE